MGLMQSGSNFTDRIVKYVAKWAERKTKPALPSRGHVILSVLRYFLAQSWRPNKSNKHSSLYSLKFENMHKNYDMVKILTNSAQSVGENHVHL